MSLHSRCGSTAVRSTEEPFQICDQEMLNLFSLMFAISNKFVVIIQDLSKLSLVVLSASMLQASKFQQPPIVSCRKENLSGLSNLTAHLQTS